MRKITIGAQYDLSAGAYKVRFAPPPVIRTQGHYVARQTIYSLHGADTMIESLPFVICTLGLVLQAVVYYYYYIIFQYPVSPTNVRIALYISISTYFNRRK